METFFKVAKEIARIFIHSSNPLDRVSVNGIVQIMLSYNAVGSLQYDNSVSFNNLFCILISVQKMLYLNINQIYVCVPGVCMCTCMWACT